MGRNAAIQVKEKEKEAPIQVKVCLVSGEELMTVRVEPSWTLFRFAEEVQSAVTTGVVASFACGDKVEPASLYKTVASLGLQPEDVVIATIEAVDKQWVGTYYRRSKGDSDFDQGCEEERLILEGDGRYTWYHVGYDQMSMDDPSDNFEYTDHGVWFSK